jgi:hypothetical protein
VSWFDFELHDHWPVPLLPADGRTATFVDSLVSEYKLRIWKDGLSPSEQTELQGDYPSLKTIKTRYTVRRRNTIAIAARTLT